MDDVKRYRKDSEILGRVLVAAKDGDYVRYTDYTALRARLEAVEKERAAITKNTLRIYEAWEATKAELSRAAEALATARRDERERCASLADEMSEKRDAEMTSFIDDTAEQEADFGRAIATAIRAIIAQEDAQ
jgi:hypothetical protein